MNFTQLILLYFSSLLHVTFGEQLITFGNNGNIFQSKRKAHTISRRAIDSSSVCKKDPLDVEATKKIQKHAFPLKEDRHIDLDEVFVGRNSETQLLITTSPQSFIGMILMMGHHSSSTIYQTTDGGRTFQKLDSKINSASIRNKFGIMVSPLDRDWMILASYTPFISTGSFNMHTNQNAFLLISKNGSKNFTSVKVPFKLRDGEPLLFHPKKKEWVIALEERQTISLFGKVSYYGKAYISKDFGSTWKVMNGDHIAATVKWGLAEGKEGDEIFMTTHQKSPDSLFNIFNTFSSSSTLTLWRSSDGGETFETIIEHCYRFGVQGEFVFASVMFNVKSETEDNPHNQKRILHVSKDSGKTFHAVNVPTITHDRFYSVEDMEKGMIFLHVDDPGDTGKGILYMSGSDGLMFTKSLTDHFYTNMGRHTDFTKIESMHGVYITQVLAKDSTLKSVITFNRGVSWQPLYVDKKKYCNNTSGECTLHFHKVYSNAKQHTDIQYPLSSSSAPGIIFLHGQAGDALTGSAQVWLSTNGGYNWTMVDNVPHHYAIGDAGNLLITIPQLNNTGNYLKYSIDQGRCWQKYRFYDNNEEFVVRGLVTEPFSKERTFSLWGYAKNVIPDKRIFTVITVHFHGMFSKLCESSNLEEWAPHADNGKSGCFLGEKLFYGRPKLDADCYLGKDFKPLLKKEACKCTRDDIECDYGYEKDTDDKCKLNLSIKPIEVCKKGEVVKERFSKGYRRLPGDICTSTDEDEIIKFVDEKKKCEISKEKIDVFGVVQAEKKLAAEIEQAKKKEAAVEKEPESHYQQTVIHPRKKKGHSFFFVIGVLALIGVVFGVGFYGVRHVRNSRYVKPTYIMSDLLDEDVNDSNTVFDSRPKSYRPFKDESDVEDDVMLPV